MPALCLVLLVLPSKLCDTTAMLAVRCTTVSKLVASVHCPLQRYCRYTDRRESCLKEPGEILDCLASGLITEDHIRGEIGQVLAGTVGGRRSDDEVTVFESLGIAVEDLAAALCIYRNCLEGDQIPEGCQYMNFH
jgi:ornithine cyclodeaminase/alanine dehydrogenase-like protein (mu-crystallin family)